MNLLKSIWHYFFPVKQEIVDKPKFKRQSYMIAVKKSFNRSQTIDKLLLMKHGKRNLWFRILERTSAKGFNYKLETGLLWKTVSA